MFKNKIGKRTMLFFKTTFSLRVIKLDEKYLIFNSIIPDSFFIYYIDNSSFQVNWFIPTSEWKLSPFVTLSFTSSELSINVCYKNKICVEVNQE